MSRVGLHVDDADRAARHPADVGHRRAARRARTRLGQHDLGGDPVRHGARRDVGRRSVCARSASSWAIRSQSKGANILLGPTMNIHRSPLAGRNFECYSEDPFLSARIAVGVRRRACSRCEGMGACIKHYVANDSEFERMTISSEVDERTLREVYLVAVRGVRQRGAGVVDHDRVQQAQRDVLRRARLAAARRPARRVGLRGLRHQRLVGHEVHGPLGERRPRSRDARPRRVVRRRRCCEAVQERRGRAKRRSTGRCGGCC